MNQLPPWSRILLLVVFLAVVLPAVFLLGYQLGYALPLSVIEP